MQFFEKLKQKFFAKPPEDPLKKPAPTDIKRELVLFKDAYRIGIIGIYSGMESQEVLDKFRKYLEQLGYECDVLMYINEDYTDPKIYLSSFNNTEVIPGGQPNSPRVDRFMMKKYDLLFNAHFSEAVPLRYISKYTYARCRVAPYLDPMKDVADLLVPVQPGEELPKLLSKFCETLEIRPYVRK